MNNHVVRFLATSTLCVLGIFSAATCYKWASAFFLGNDSELSASMASLCSHDRLSVCQTATLQQNIDRTTHQVITTVVFKLKNVSGKQVQLRTVAASELESQANALIAEYAKQGTVFLRVPRQRISVRSES